ncbi:hypothetical protein BV210_11565 [Halorientalis sp. IM1011]|uniref:helix-turn-helix domain-containing protein n=1 Tax=Halorientalis sp. IM1011 TaxID=1932360 RepID=UPI00097CCB09|nr:helix-turn-helix domain-containing protein [Halorientalis sp. IM1011]AQL43291.1 hypothetical protein BV210_11565 [Halorientalis sp. IM1011]
MAGRKPEVSDIEILRQFALSSDPVLGANELTETFDMSRQGIDYRLRQLAEDGLLESKIISRDRVYWLTDDGRERIATEHEP